MLLVLASCDDDSHAFTNITEELNYTTFLELLEVNGISFVETEREEWDVGFLSVLPRRIYVDGEQITIYEFPSNRAMETAAGFVNRSGFGIDNLNTGHSVRISWVSNPYWFKRDFIIVNYVGTNRQIIRFLREALQQFAGHGVDTDAIDESDITVEEHISSSNEINLPFLYIENLVGEGFRTIQLTTGWTFFDEHGNSIGGINSDSLHPLQLSPQAFDSGASIAIRYNPNSPVDLEFLRMNFMYGEPARTHIPHSITVTRWKIDYASGNHNVIGIDEGETVESINPSYPTILNPGHLNEMIPILADGYDYIYMVEAVWQEGSSIFTFRTTSLLIDEPIMGNPPPPTQSDSSYEVGRVWLIINGNEYNPGEHFLHGAMDTEHGSLSASGIPFEFWLENNLNYLPKIQYAPDMRIMVEGEYGSIVTFPREHPMYFEGYRQIGVSAENFVDGVGAVTIPFDSDSGTYLVYVDITWSGGGNDFSRMRYVFKIVR